MYPTVSPTTVKPWISQALSNRLLYGDGEPHWKNDRGQQQAERDREQTFRFLSKHAFASRDLRHPATALEYCAPTNRCLNGACPQCGRAFQRFIVLECGRIFEAEETCIASVIDSRMSTYRDIGAFSAAKLMNRTKTLLKANGVTIAIGGIDFSFNEDKQKSFASHWCAHLWLILPKVNCDQWANALRVANPKSSAIRRPIMIKDCDGQNDAYAYALKTTFKRRVSICRKGRRNTSEQDLRVSERLELYRSLHSAGLHSRLFLLGIRPTKTNRGIALRKLKSNQ